MYAQTGTIGGGSLGGGMVTGPAGGNVAYYGGQSGYVGQGASMTAGGVGGAGGGGGFGYQGSAARGGAAMVTGPGANSAMFAGGQQASFGGGGVMAGGGAGGDACCGPVGACGTADACGGTGGGAGQLAFVGGGRGSYTTETQYRYVGAGAGEFDYVKPAPNYCVCIVSSGVLLVLLGLLLWFLFKDQTQTTTPTFGCVGCLRKCQYVLSNNCVNMIQRSGIGGTTFPSSGPCSQIAVTKACMQCASFGSDCQAAAPSGPVAYCIVFGDPHVKTFDREEASYYSTGEYWIVKSATVWIQGKYAPTHATSGLAVMKEIGFGGPFMKGHKLIISATQAWYDGQLVMPTLGSALNNELVQGVYNDVGGLLQNGRGGKALKTIHLNLPMGVQVQVNRWTERSEGEYINAKITMSAQPGQDGHCGNFNGNPADDVRMQVRARVGVTGVAQTDMIFTGPKTPIAQGNRPDINDCPGPKLDSCKGTCKAKEHKFIPSKGCLIDCCFASEGFVAEGA